MPNEFEADEDFRKVIAEGLGIPLEDIVEDSTLQGLSNESLDIQETIIELLDHYDVELPEDYEHRTLGEIRRYLVSGGAVPVEEPKRRRFLRY